MITPLVKKLGIKSGMDLMILNSPFPYSSLVEDIPEKVIFRISSQGMEIDFVHLFCRTFEELKQDYHHGKSLLKKTGIYWISWPKKSSEVYSDLSRDIVRTFVLSEGLVDVKICSLNEDWSGLKFVYRLNNR